MKDEIKEILNKWKCYIELTKKFTTNEYEMLRVEDIDKILDYITNLQEENERLKQNLSKGITNNLENKYLNNKLYKDLEDYKTRNEKAIEYIKKHCDYGYAGQKCLTDVLYRYEAEELLEILQGSDE